MSVPTDRQRIRGPPAGSHHLQALDLVAVRSGVEPVKEVYLTYPIHTPGRLLVWKPVPLLEFLAELWVLAPIDQIADGAIDSPGVFGQDVRIVVA